MKKEERKKEGKMKTSKWKKVCSLGLAFVMALSLTACSDGKGGDKSSSGKKNDPNANNAMAKEYVYRTKDLGIGGGDGDLNLLTAGRNGDSVEMVVQEYVYEDYNSTQKLSFYKMNVDGSGLTNIQLEEPVDPVSETQQGESQGESSEGPEVPISDGEMQIFDGETDASYEGGDDWEDYVPEDYSYESNYYNNAILTKNAIYAIRTHYKDGYQNGEYVNENSQGVCCWDKNGKLQWMSPIDLEKYQNDDEWSYVVTMLPYGESSIGLVMNGSKNGIIEVGSDGKVSALKKMNADRDIFSADPNIVLREDGTALVSYYNDDWSKQYITTFDPKTGSVGAEYEVPATARAQGFYNFAAGKKMDIIFSNYDGVFGFNLGDTETVKMMDYVNSDLATYSLGNLVEIDDTTFLASYNDMTDYRQNFCLFTYVKPEDIKDKKTMVYAGLGIDTDVKAGIIRFNKESDEYRIVVKDYSSYNTVDDYSAGQTRLNNDIIAGNIPDILQVDSSMPINSYVEKGLLANVDELIKNDAELSQIEYMDNVFEAFRIKGTLYQVVSRFTVNTWIGKKSMVGDGSSWTMSDVKQAASKLKGDKTIFGWDGYPMARADFLDLALSYCGNDFVDLKTGKCNFDNDLFVDLLEYAKTLPETSDVDYSDDYWENYWENYTSQWRENRSLLMQLNLGDLSNAKYQVKGYMGEDVTYVGFPTESGSGSYVQVYNSHAIFEKSPNKEGAWKYLRTFLTEDYQKNEDYKYGYFYGMPVVKKYIREQADKLMERPYWEDENGVKNYYDDTFYMNGEDIIIEPFTQAEADALFNFVCSVKKANYYDENVTKIVEEEAGSFFSGAKSAKDVAGMIQSRVQLYVNENK